MSIVGITIAAVVLGILGFATWRRPRLMGTILWSLVAAILLVCASIVLTPGELLTRIIFITFFSPIVWVGLMFWCYYDKRQWRAVGSLFVLSIASIGVIIVSGPIA